MTPRNYAEAFSAYSYARQRAFDLVRSSLVTRGVLGLGLAIRPFDEAAVEAWERTWRNTRHWSRKGGFPWHLLHRRYCRKPRNFHVSLWYDDTLCGLAVGRLSEKHERLALHFMEGSPDPGHALRGNVADVVFAGAQLYARAVGAEWLILKSPDPDLEHFYQDLGFGLAYEERGTRYCKRPV